MMGFCQVLFYAQWFWEKRVEVNPIRIRIMLLKNIARILVKHAGNAVGFGVAGDAILEIWDSWNKEKQDPQEKLAEVQQLAQQTAGETRQMAADIALEFAADQSEEVRQTLTTYLTQVPAMVRRSLRRPGDPSGTTIPPGVLMTKADDLRTLLPAKVSHFKPGDYPFAGVDLELVELLGIGGFGEVWKARNPNQRSDPAVALKFCIDAAAAASLRHEAILLDRVKSQGTHTGIVKLLRTYLRASPPCLEYEYIEGGDLGGLIHDWHRSSTGCSPDMVARLMLQLAGIVGFAHRLNPPIVHRDLKPANILVQKAENGEPKLKVADFGIGGIAASQVIAESRSDLTRGVMAATVARGSYTPLYASPQQMAGMPADPHDDVYALGVIWYQLLTGDLNSGAPSGMQWSRLLLQQGVPEAQVQLLAACVEPQPDYRPKDAAELAQQLEGVEVVVNSLGMKFAWISPGTFLMGSPESEEQHQPDEKQHRVTLTKGFFLGIHQVTQAQWQAIMGSNSRRFKGDTLPVEKVSWDDCQEFCKKLSQKTGKPHRLPTEAEWEYAGRAGTTTPFHFGATISTEQANYKGNKTYGGGNKGQYRKESTPVGSFPANAWGLYDMHGNVWEWCQDWHGHYPSEDVVDPKGVDSGSAHVLRGGSWGDYPWDCRAACRGWGAPGDRYDGFGVRVVFCLD